MPAIWDKLKFRIKTMLDLDDKNPRLTKIRLSDNVSLTDAEFAYVSKFCDIFAAIGEVAADKVTPPDGGVFWSMAKKGTGPFDLHLRKDRNEIDHSFLLNTRFRDFPAIAYDMDEHTPNPDFWVRRYIRLARAVPKKWHVKIPARFGEIGWNVCGSPVNRLTSINQERINSLHLMGITQYLEAQTAPKIMEIGAGSGEMGYTLCNALPACTWFDCDLLGSLVYSAIHLAVLLPKKRHYIYVGNLDLPAGLDESLILRSAEQAAEMKNAVISIPNFLINDFAGHLNLHFAYNTYSFGEMPQSAAEHYIELLGGFLKERGILFEQNGYFPDKGGDNVIDILAKTFKQQMWLTLFEEDPILNGASRSWFNNAIGADIFQLTPDRRKNAVILSLDDKGDRVDIEYSTEAWSRIRDLFPHGV